MNKNSVLHVQSCCVTLSSFAFLILSSPLHLKLPVIGDTLWSVNRIFSEQIELLLYWYHPKRFFDSSVVPSILVRKEENESFPCTHNLGERTEPPWRDNRCRALITTHQKNSGVDTARRLGTIIQSIFVPNRELAFAWSFGNGKESVPRGSSAPAWKLS